MPSKAKASSENSTPYPYTRSEECSWHPEDVARHLSSLVGGTGGHSSLLSYGWPSRQVETLRSKYGSNRMHGDAVDDEKTFRDSIKPILSALLTQLKEPLILMLLGSAGISLILGNTADAISISLALFIVGLVAAVQEYRSEAALEKLSHLVPHTCTVLRDGKVIENFGAWDLVVGDLVLLSTGE